MGSVGFGPSPGLAGGGGGGAAAETAQAGDAGFEFDTACSGTVSLTKVNGQVFMYGQVNYTGALADIPELFALPAEWGDPIGADKFCVADSNPAHIVVCYLTGTGLAVGSVGAAANGGYLALNSFWNAPA